MHAAILQLVILASAVQARPQETLGIADSSSSGPVDMFNFSVAMLAKASEDLKEANVVLSPLSLHLSLGMLLSASEKDSLTQKQLLDAFGPSDDVAQVERHLNSLVNEYKAKGSLSLGNAMWVKPDLQSAIDSSYVDKVSELYHGQVNALSDRDEDSVASINQWVQQSTNHQITEIVDSLEPDVEMVLANALFFKDAWKVMFDSVNQSIPFTLASGQEKVAPFMTQKSTDVMLATFFMAEGVFPDVRFSAASVPYQDQDGRFEMVFLMAEKQFRPALAEVLAKEFDMHNVLRIAMKELSSARLTPSARTITVPRFSVASKLDAKGQLMKLGLTDIFERTARLPALGNNVLVNRMQHAASVDVSPDGTVASAATSIEIVGLSATFSDEEIVFDKPFIFLVRDTKTHAVLFIGKLDNPTGPDSIE